MLTVTTQACIDLQALQGRLVSISIGSSHVCMFVCTRSLRGSLDTASTDYERMALTELEPKSTVQLTPYAPRKWYSYDYGHVKRESQHSARLELSLQML